jgi:long-subunit fatty acid transport protein
LALCFVVSLGLGAGPALAQSASAINGGIQFDFSLPGARSLGMAGAFVALADDATASQANPAGLTILTRPEISFEVRGFNFYSLTPSRGNAFGSASGIGVDTVSGVRNEELLDSTVALPSFLSAVWPRPSWVIAAYRQEFSKFENRILSNGPFFTSGSDIERLNPVTAQIELNIVGYGVSAARRVGPRLSIGGGFAFYTFSLHSRSESYLVQPHAVTLRPEDRAANVGVGQQFGPADFSEGNVFFRQEQDGENNSYALNAGMMFEASSRFSIGASVRQGPDFEYRSRFFGGPAHAQINSPLSNTLIDEDEGILFHVPDSYAVGVRYRHSGNLSIALEYNRVQYSQILNGDGNGQAVETAGQLESNDPIVREEGRKTIAGLALSDSNQIRFGGEWFASGP